MKKGFLFKVNNIFFFVTNIGVSVFKGGGGGGIRGFVAIGIVSFVYIKIILLMEMKND